MPEKQAAIDDTDGGIAQAFTLEVELANLGGDFRTIPVAAEGRDESSCTDPVDRAVVVIERLIAKACVFA